MGPHREFLVLFVSSVVFVAGMSSLLYQHISFKRTSAAAAASVPVAVYTKNPPSNATTSSLTDASSTSTSNTSTTTIEDTPSTTCPDTTPKAPAPARYAYKLVMAVDPCMLNTLGKDGWTPLQYGTDPNNAGEYLINGGGKDENCTNPKTYRVFIWILFQKTLSDTTSN